MKSYRLDQPDEYTAAFARDGFVVVDDVLSADECARSVDEVWAFLEKDGRVRRDDEATWGDEHWPPEICRNGGFVGRFPYWKRVHTLEHTGVRSQPQAWRNRENPRVHAVFATLLRTQRLWVSVDRYGVMRPARLRSGGGSATESEIQTERQTKHHWLHWDLSPFHLGTSAAGFAPAPLTAEDAARYGSVRVQGLLALVDCPEASGGFHCVPRFAGSRFFDWADAHREAYGTLPEVAGRNFVEVPADDPMRAEVTRVPMKAGSLLVWNSQLPHGNFPNTGFDFRMVQYLKMIPVSDPREFTPAMKLQRFETSEWFPNGYTPSALGEMLFGIKDWPETEEEAAAVLVDPRTVV